HTQTQENIIAEEPIGYSPTTTSPKKDLISTEEQHPDGDHNGIDVEDDKKARPIPIEDAVSVEQEPSDYQKAEEIHIENDPLAVELLEELNVSVEPTVAESEAIKQGVPMEHEPYLISPKNGLPSKLDDEHLDTGPKPSDRLKSAESREDEEFREAERRAELELDSELVIHDNEAAPAAKENERDLQSPKEVLQEVQPTAPSPTVEGPKKDNEKTGIQKPTSRLVRPQNRVIHTSPQSGGVPARAQSAARPSSAMPKPTAHTAAVRSLRPPAPRPVAKSSSKEQLNKKPAPRTQSQPRPPKVEAKAVSQPATPKVYRKVVAVSSKVGSFTDHKPSGGNVQIFSETRTYKVQPKVGSLNNVTHTPGGGNVKIPNIKLDFKEKAKPKIDAKSEYVPPVPEKKILSQKLVWNAQSKVGSLDNVKHKPAGGNVQIFDERIQYISSTPNHHRSNSSSLNNVNNQSRTASRTQINLLDL
uniref:Microtubule-associated protein n=1 Tax=Haemonchus contortus TaxID=6289 RepID=A0A7I4YAY5_HAECO